MDLHPNQQAAVEAVKTAIAEGLSLLIKGKAGTGKSTVVIKSLEAIKEMAGGRNVVATSFTNKAVGRMVEIGFPKEHAMTCHRLLFQSEILIKAAGYSVPAKIVSDAVKKQRAGNGKDAIEKVLHAMVFEIEDLTEEAQADEAKRFLQEVILGQFESETVEVLKEAFNKRDIIIVDEVGMLRLDMAELIKERYDTVIFMGDHRQLKPVEGEDTINVIETDIVAELTHVFRSGDAILDLADRAEKDNLGYLPPALLSNMPELYGDDWQVLAYTNKDVFNTCLKVRANAGIMGRKPQAGEGLISYGRLTAFNMVEGKLIECQDEIEALREKHEEENPFQKFRSPYQIKRKDSKDPKKFDDDMNELCWKVYSKPIAKNTMFKAGGLAFKYGDDVAISVDLGDGKKWYVETCKFWTMDFAQWSTARKIGVMNVFFSHAITVHRAQGSEFPNVLFKVRDRFAARPDEDPDERRRFNYSGITRAKKSVIACSNFVY